MSRNIPNHLSEHQKDFIKRLDHVVTWEGHRRDEVFRIFLEMAYNAVKKTTCIGAEAEKCEEEYMRAVGRLHRKPTQSATTLSECMGLIVLALEKEGLHDFLGPIFMETVSDPAKGQFFTPDELSLAMAMMLLSDAEKQLEHEQYITAQEPAGGTGGIVLSACRKWADKRLDFSRRFIWQVIELDRAAYMGCYVQLSMAGINAEIVNGNTLSLEVFDRAITPVRFMHPYPFTKARKKVNVRKRERPAKPATRQRKRPASSA